MNISNYIPQVPTKFWGLSEIYFQKQNIILEDEYEKDLNNFINYLSNFGKSYNDMQEYE